MARYFNGTSDYIALADCAALTLAPPWTIGGWIRVAEPSTLRQLFSWYDGAASDKFDLYLRGNLSPENTMSATVVDSDGDSRTFYSYATPRIGSVTYWQHYLLRCQADRQYHHFVNGTQYSGVQDASIGSINPASSFLIGKRSTNTWYWKGDMAELAKWDTDLSDDEIAALAVGVRPVEIGPRPRWYLPLAAGLHEEIGGIAVTSSGTAVSEHPPAVVRQGIAQTLRIEQAAIAGPYRLAASAIHSSGIAAGQTFSAGITIGQTNG